NRLTASFSLFPQKRDFFNLNSFTPRDTSANFHQRGWFFALNEQAAFRSGALLQSGFSVKQFDADIFGNSEQSFRITPEQRIGGWFNHQHRESRRYELLEVLNLPEKEWRGRHTFKLGLNLSRTSFDGTDTSAPVRVVRADGTTSQLITFAGDGNLSRNNFEYSLFVQDKWNLNDRVTLDLGLRYDRDGIGRRNNFAPRVGFAMLPTDSARTVIRGGVGLFYDKIPLSVGVFEQYQNFVIMTLAGDGGMPLNSPRQLRNVVADGEFQNPLSVAWNLQADHELTPKLLLRLGYEERQTRRDFVIDPQLNDAGNSALVLQNDGRSSYREFQATARYRLQERRNLFLAYVRSRSTGDLNDFDTYFGNARNPVLRPNERSLQPFDAPNRLLFWGDVGLPYDVTVTPVVDWRSGFPFSLLDEDQNYVGARNRAGRFPPYFALDLQVTKGLTIPIPALRVIPATFRGRKVRGRAGVKLFNVTNHWNPRDVQENIAAPDFGTFYNSVRRSIRLKFEFVKF
ncbi:MAG: TonB-dependent receptor, partial [Acidobacteriota bacterium]|nr:TonB-dependent receptor [Acidobacteriota bacterium]